MNKIGKFCDLSMKYRTVWKLWFFCCRTVLPSLTAKQESIGGLVTPPRCYTPYHAHSHSPMILKNSPMILENSPNGWGGVGFPNRRSWPLLPPGGLRNAPWAITNVNIFKVTAIRNYCLPFLDGSICHNFGSQGCFFIVVTFHLERT